MKKTIVQLITKSGEVYKKSNRSNFSNFMIESISYRAGVLDVEHQVIRDEPHYLITLKNESILPGADEYAYELIPYTEMQKIRFIEE